MGLQDRDYMHERWRRDRPFTPPESGSASNWLVILCVVATVFALYRGYDWLLERRAMQQAPKQPTDTAQPPVADGAPAAPNPLQPWTQCIINGRVLYTETSCPDNLSSIHSTAGERPRPTEKSPASVNTLYHCKDYGGGTFWANTHCNQHKALVDRMANVPGSLPFDQQVRIAESQRQSAAVQPTVNVVNTTVIQPTRREECKALDAQIVHWDAMARQPQSASTQDWIRGQRKNARDRQFALRC